MKHDLSRVVVIGNAGVGKTTFAQALAKILDVPHIEMDGIHWGPSWTPRPLDVVRERVEKETAGARWVFDGNYSMVRDIVWARASTVVWLNYPFLTGFRRLLRRTTGRMIRREVIFSGNRETFRSILLSRDSLLWYEIKTHARRRREFRALFDGGEYPDVTTLEFQRPHEAEAFLNTL